MNREILKRLELLEAAREATRNASEIGQGLGHFYCLSSEERGRRVACLYPTDRPIPGMNNH